MKIADCLLEDAIRVEPLEGPCRTEFCDFDRKGGYDPRSDGSGAPQETKLGTQIIEEFRSRAKRPTGCDLQAIALKFVVCG